ncbi:endonuclease/exonuclease/phosphatase family protein [Aliiroseovarius sp. YM-037]|uniref:endonuclease/exonuclease/phosphatase family protein n=1 Tax=Aliiroseovarius sp. YM-037 TaxID=3341728 RepID=UPI003A80ECF0
MPLRVASYNIRKCVGLDRKRAPGRVIDVMNGLDADVIAVQEADRRLGARPAALPRDVIAADSDFEPAALAVNGVSLGWHGNALLLRKGMALRDTARIDLPGLEPRGAVLAEIDSDDGPVRIVGLHLGLIRRYRLQQLAAVRAALARRDEMPTIILGDFNEWTPDRGMEPLEGAFTVHSPGMSFHAARPVAGLDRVALCNRVALRDAGVVETPVSSVASDHLPIWADLAISETPAPPSD